LFTLLAFALVSVAQSVPWLHREGLRPVGQPLRSDPAAAQILPFVVFMVTSTFISAMFLHPGLGLPLNTVALAIAAAFFLPVYRTLPWRPDALAVGVGLVVGWAWVLMAPPPDRALQEVLTGLSAGVLVAWAVARILGTVILVPLVEEMFFRGYMLARLDGPQLWRRAGAIAVSSLAFAALHGRWVEAGLAGVAFAAVMLRRGRVTDAVWAHVAANAVVAAAAALRGDWSLI
jgi:exosortase E/protease (VPEID-CTERM system)